MTWGGQCSTRATTRLDFGDLPIVPVMREDGSPLEVSVEFGERDAYCKLWKARVGRINLYLLDTDLERNRPEDRATAHRLYGATATRASSRRSCSAWAASARWKRWQSSPRPSTTRATRRSWCWSACAR